MPDRPGIQRYDIDGFDHTPFPCDDGPLVRYEDHVAALVDAEQQRDAYKGDVDGLLNANMRTDAENERLRDHLARLRAALEQQDGERILHDAQRTVRNSPLWKRFIDGNPLSNDIAVWIYDAVIEERRRLKAVLAKTAPPSQEPT